MRKTISFDTLVFSTGEYPREVGFKSNYAIDERNAIHIDPRSHLEVSDKHHRYAKNLRLYFQEFVRIRGLKDVSKDLPTTLNDLDKLNLFEQFFAWLDDDKCKPELEECLRSTLDSDVVQYLTLDDQRTPFLLRIDEQGRFLVPRTNINTDGCNSSSSAPSLNDTLKDKAQASLQPPSTSNVSSSSSSGLNLSHMSLMHYYKLLDTGPDGWIFVVRGGHFFAHCKQTKSFPRFHHSTFFAGSDVEFAGALVCESGRLRRLYPHSGHYRPQEKHLLQLLRLLRAKHVPLGQEKNVSGDISGPVLVDGQRALHVARTFNTMGEKLKKVEAAYMVSAETLMELLEWRQQRRNNGLLSALSGTSSQGQGYLLNHSHSLGHSLDSSAAGSPAQTRTCPWMHTGTPSSVIRWTRLRDADCGSFSEHDGGGGSITGPSSVQCSPWPSSSSTISSGSRIVNGIINGSPRATHYPRSQLRSSAESRAQVLADMLSPSQSQAPHCASSYPGASGRGAYKVPESTSCLCIDSPNQPAPWREDGHAPPENENFNSKVSRYSCSDGTLLLPISQNGRDINESGQGLSRGSSDESVPSVSPFLEFQNQQIFQAPIQSRKQPEQPKVALFVDTSMPPAGGLARAFLKADHLSDREESLESTVDARKITFFESYNYQHAQQRRRFQYGYDETNYGNEDLDLDNYGYDTFLQTQAVQNQEQEYLDKCVQMLLADSPSLRRTSRKKVDFAMPLSPVDPAIQQRSRAPSAQIFAGTPTTVGALLPRTSASKSPPKSRDRDLGLVLSAVAATAIDDRP